MESSSNTISSESINDYQEMRRQLEKENQELKKKLTLFGIIPDSTFLPLKPDSENDLTRSKQAIFTATLTDDSAVSSYRPLPDNNKNQDDTDQETSTILQKRSLESRIEAMLPAKENAERVMKKADLLLERTEGLRTTFQRTTNDSADKSLSDYTLASDGFSVTPQRPQDGGRQVRIGSRQLMNNDYSDMTSINPESTLKSPKVNGKLIGKKLDFENSSDEEFSTIHRSSNPPQIKKLDSDHGNNWGKRIVGEIAFQLDRRILQYVFSHRRRLYGYTVRNISEKIKESTYDDRMECCDTAKAIELERKRDMVFRTLYEQARYECKYHAVFSELVVNKYGILKVNPCDSKDQLKVLQDVEVLRKLVLENAGSEYKKDASVLLRALNAMSLLDNKPVLSW